MSDTSPINNLAAISQLVLLQQLYETVIIPEAVYRELTDADPLVAGATEVQALEWIQTRQVTNHVTVTLRTSTVKLRAPAIESRTRKVELFARNIRLRSWNF